MCDRQESQTCLILSAEDESDNHSDYEGQFDYPHRSDFPMTPEKEQALKDYIKGIAQILYEETSPEAWMGEKFV